MKSIVFVGFCLHVSLETLFGAFSLVLVVVLKLDHFFRGEFKFLGYWNAENA